MDIVTDVIVAGAGSPWLYIALFALVAIDGFFPPMPSESVIVALGALAVSTGTPHVALLLLVAAAGAIAGDTVAFSLGRRFGTDRFAWMRRPRVQGVVSAAETRLSRRAASFIVTARFIPIGRVAVNITAGATGFPRRRFVLLSAVAGSLWAVWSVLIGVAAGAWLHDYPALGVVVSVIVALGLGLVIDAVASRLEVRRRRRAPRAQLMQAPSA